MADIYIQTKHFSLTVIQPRQEIFIGFEISAEYCDIAEKRIASVGKDIPLFEAD